MKTNDKKTPMEPRKKYIPPTLYLTTTNHGLTPKDISDHKIPPESYGEDKK